MQLQKYFPFGIFQIHDVKLLDQFEILNPYLKRKRKKNWEIIAKYTANKFAVLDREMCLSKP